MRREDYVFGGYIVTERAARPGAGSAEPEPTHLVTASACISRFGGQLGWPTPVTSTEVVIALADQLSSAREWLILGLSLRLDHRESFLERNSSLDGRRPSGVSQLVCLQKPMPEGGIVLGFEPLRFESEQRRHSWRCDRLEDECFRALGVRPNSDGLLRTEDEAEKVTSHIQELEDTALGWFPWMIVDYTIESRPPTLYVSSLTPRTLL